jgi:hypothetical protein
MHNDYDIHIDEGLPPIGDFAPPEKEKLNCINLVL